MEEVARREYELSLNHESALALPMVAHDPPQQPKHPLQSRTTAVRMRAKRSRNPSRERLQSELRQLRDLCDELEQRLDDLQRLAPSLQCQEEELAMRTAWEYIARCQQHKRARAEEENATLRAQVQRQLVVLKNLQQAVRQVPGVLDELSSSTASASRGCFDLTLGFPQRSPIEQEDTAVYEVLSSEADAAFLRMEKVFQANGLSSWRAKDASELWTQAPMKTQRSSQTVSDSHCIQLTDVDVLPFAKESVFRALWQCWEQQYAAKNCVAYELQHLSSSSGDSLAGRMRYDECVDGECVPLEILFVLKLFVECDRICYVWRSTSTASTSVTEICIEETWWEELRTVPAQNGAVEGTLTLSCSHMESKTLKAKNPAACVDAAADGAIAAPLLTSVLISSYEADVVDVTCRMMDLLLEETDDAPVLRAA